MKRRFLLMLILAMSLFNRPVFSQAESEAEKDTTLLGLPGDNLDLYAVLDLFQKSKTIEDFEKSLNSEKTGINNLDLDLDKKVDFIKVETKKDKDDFMFILQVDVSKTEKQDVAVILVSKDENKKVTMQIVGDEDLYGKNYIVELKETVTPSSTPNPAYTGDDPVVVTVPASTTTVVVESAPIVQYVYSPAYVPYYPPYYYGYYPPYFAAFTVMAVGIYRSNHYYGYHGGGYGYHGNTVVVHNHNTYNNYNNSRNRSSTVSNNRASGNYNRASNTSGSTRPSTGGGGSTRPSTQPSTRPSTGGGASTRPSTQPSVGGGASTRPSTQPSTRPSNMGGGSTRPSTQPSTSNYGSSGNRSSGYSSGGGSRGSGGYSSGGSSRGSGGGGSRGGGGGSRGGGGGRR